MSIPVPRTTFDRIRRATEMRRTPADLAVDRALGLTDAKLIELRNATILLACTSCGKEKRVMRHDIDPPGSVLLESECPKCNAGDQRGVVYYDAEGREVPLNVE